MPAKNPARNIADIGGNISPSVDNTESPFRAVPDVRFSDTTLVVVNPETHVNAIWNVPIIGFSRASLFVSWSAVYTNGNAFPSNFDNVTVLSADGHPSGIIVIEFPDLSYGSVRVIVQEKTVTSALDNRTKGPPAARSFVVEFDRRENYALRETSPATLDLSEPTTEVWRNATYLQGFYFSSPASDFDETDVNITVVGSGSATLSNFQKTQEDNKLYTADINLTGSGTITVRVPENSAKSGGSTEDNTPSAAVEKTWDFDRSLDTTTFSIAGVDVLCQETYAITNHPERETPSDGGLFLGVSDMKVFDGQVFFTSQIQKADVGTNYKRSTILPSAGALVSVLTGGGSCVVHKKYNFFRKAARSLVVHKGDLHFFEGSAYIYDGSALPNFTLANVGEGLGVIQRLTATGSEILPLGVNWRSSFPTGVNDRYDGIHGGTMCPMISHDDDLHLISQKIDFFDIDGCLWITHSKKLNQRVALLQTNGRTGFEVIEELASISNAIVGFSTGTFNFIPRSPNTALVSVQLSASATTLEYKNRNRSILWGTSGSLIVNQEIISYTGITSTRFTGLARGQNGTTAVAHAIDSKITRLNKVVHADALERPINEMDIDIDGTLLYNDILVKYAENQVPRVEFLSFPARDADSITRHGKHKFDLVLPLDYHQNQWAIVLANDYLERYKELQVAVTLMLKRDINIKLGNVIHLEEPVISNFSNMCQVMSVSQIKASEQTEIVVVSLG